MSAIPATVVTIFGVMTQVYRSGIRWSFVPLTMILGLMGWVVGGLAMALTAGVVYATAVVPVCSRYSVQQQNEAGALLLWIGGALFIVLLGRGAFLLAAIARRARRDHQVGMADSAQ